jgi:phosphatidylserine decarboxylase
MSRLSIFMSPKDVHVNRAPLAGTVASVTRRPGGFVPAFRKEAEVNERVETILATEIGQVKVVQIAGAVARRIVPYLRPGQTVAKGERLGLIRLGSRCDLLVPPGTVRWTAEVDRQVRAGSSPVGDVA